MKDQIRNVLFGALLAIGLGVPYLQAADVAISALPAGSALGGTEAIPAVQSAATVKTTPAALDTYISSTSKTLTNKTINGSSNTLTVLAGSQLSGQVPLANGGTGANLTDPNADRIAFWDDSAGAVTWLTPGTGLTITTTTIDASGGVGAPLYVESADIVAQRNGTTAQTMYIYDTTDGGSNYARLVLNPGAAGAWVQVAANSAGTSGADFGLALTPAGTGALSLNVPNNAPSGGNARGANAVDFQRTRDQNTQVASGANSGILTGEYNIASGQASAVVTGQYNQATGLASVVSGGFGNLANAAYSWVPGGLFATTRGVRASWAYSSGYRYTAGDTQVLGMTQRRSTTDDTPGILLGDGTTVSATYVLVLPQEYTATCHGIVTANSSAAGVISMAGWKIEAIAKNDSGTLTVSGGTCTAIGTADAALSTASCELVPDGTRGSVEIEVTGVAATTIQWAAELKCIQSGQ